MYFLPKELFFLLMTRNLKQTVKLNSINPVKDKIASLPEDYHFHIIRNSAGFESD